MSYDEVQKIIERNSIQRAHERLCNLKALEAIIGAFTVFSDGNPIIVQGNDSRRHIIVFTDNSGIKCVLKQINIFKPYSYGINGSKGKNTKQIY